GACLARERGRAVRKQELRRAEPAREEQKVPGRGVGGRVLRPEPNVELAERDPARLAAPARMDDPALEWQQPPERRDRLRRRLLLQPRHEAELSSDDLQHRRGTYLIFAPWRIQAPSRSRSRCVIPVALPIGMTFVVTATC